MNANSLTPYPKLGLGHLTTGAGIQQNILLVNNTMTTILPLVQTAPLCTREINGTLESAGDTEFGAVMYIISVLTFYSLGIVVMMVKYLKTERKEMEEEIVLDNFFKGIPVKRIEQERQAVNRIAIQAFHTLTAAKEKQVDSKPNSARSSYAENPSIRSSSDDVDCLVHVDGSQPRRQSQYNLHPFDNIPNENFQNRRSSYDAFDRYELQDEVVSASRLSLQEGSPKKHRGRVNLQPSQERVVHEENLKSDGSYEKVPLREGNNNEHDKCYITTENEIYLGSDKRNTDIFDINSETVQSEESDVKTVHTSSSPMHPNTDSVHIKDTGDWTTSSKSHRVSFDTAAITIDSDAMLNLVNENVLTSAVHTNTCHKQRQRHDEKSILICKKQQCSECASEGNALRLDCTHSALPRSKTTEYVSNDAEHKTSGFCSCVFCKTVGVKRGDFRDKKKDKRNTKTKVKVPQISITRSSTSGEIGVPVIDYKMGMSHHTSSDCQHTNPKQQKKSNKLLLFGRSSLNLEKKSSNKVNGKFAVVGKPPVPKEKALETPSPTTYRQRPSSAISEQVNSLSDIQSYDSSSSLIHRGHANLSDVSPQSSPIKVLRLISRFPNRSSAQKQDRRRESSPSIGTNSPITTAQTRELVPVIPENHVVLLSRSAPSEFASRLHLDPDNVLPCSRDNNIVTKNKTEQHKAYTSEQSPHMNTPQNWPDTTGHRGKTPKVSFVDSTAEEAKRMLVTEL